MFTTMLRKCIGSCQYGGLVTLGGRDRVHCGRVRSWVPIVPGAALWKFAISGVRLGAVEHRGAMTAVSDSGTSFIVGPADIVEPLVAPLEATFMSNGGVWIVPCKSKFRLTFTISGRDYAVDERQLIVKEANLCVLALIAHERLDFWILGKRRVDFA